MHYFD